ncbi:hypothetical protein AVEN_56882-1 [Araneus ventricosus]|uniref:Uncharacterized protein n=1 Tax=Araneus ventricosus TaxID=182803 RepID=A0A4Y2ERA2_ARAVE|nr:hypothetical protein AVEN_56882-1 [Araneus ventricosus]
MSFTYDDVVLAIRELKPSLTVGVDNIPSFIIKGCTEFLIYLLLILFTLSLRTKVFPDVCPSSKMSSAIERPFIETRSHNDRPMNGFLSDRDGFSSGIAPKCLIGHRSADHRYRMSFASRYDRKPSSAVSWQ